MAEQIVLQPIGYVRGGRTQPVDDHWAGVESTIEIADRYSPDSLEGLDGFSHLDVVEPTWAKELMEHYWT